MTQISEKRAEEVTLKIMKPLKEESGDDAAAVTAYCCGLLVNSLIECALKYEVRAGIEPILSLINETYHGKLNTILNEAVNATKH